MKKLLFLFMTSVLATLLVVAGTSCAGSPDANEGTGGIEGTVTDPNDKPVAGMRVGIVSGTTSFPEMAPETNEEGYYQIGSVLPGTFQVAVHDREGNRIGLESVIVRSRKTSTLNFTIPVQAVSEEEDLPPAKAEPEEEEVKWAADGVLGDIEYLGEMSYDNYEIRWLIDDQYIYIGIRAKTTGWVAVGIKPTSAMKDADMIFGFVKDGVTTVFDQFSTGIYGPHSPDIELGGTNDILEFDGKEEGGYTTIEFKRRLSTGDEYDVQVASGETKIIWAYGSSDNMIQRHVKRGFGEITLGP